MTTSAPPTPQNAQQTVAQSQTANRDTAVAQTGLNSTNQITPQGNLTYDQVGTWSDGTPRFSATTTLSPEQQALYNQYTTNQTKLGSIGGNQIDRIGAILGTPFDLNSATNNQQYDMYRKLLDPVWNQREGATETSLANKGIAQGSTAYTNALRDFAMQRDNSYTDAALKTRAQAVSEALANRNQPINEISALMSGSGVSQPNFVSTPTTNIAATNVGGITNDTFQGQMAGWQGQAAQQNALVGGLFGLAGAAVNPFGYAAGRGTSR